MDWLVEWDLISVGSWLTKMLHLIDNVISSKRGFGKHIVISCRCLQSRNAGYWVPVFLCSHMVPSSVYLDNSIRLIPKQNPNSFIVHCRWESQSHQMIAMWTPSMLLSIQRKWSCRLCRPSCLPVRGPSSRCQTSWQTGEMTVTQVPSHS